MRRKDREVKYFGEIVDILSRCNTIRLGLNGADFPYVVPLSFGFEVESGGINIYFHGAKEGLKHDLIAKDNKVCIEADIFHKYTELPKTNTATTEYESFIGFGRAVIVYGKDALRGLDLICEHTGFKGFNYGGEQVLNVTRVYKVEIEKFSGKRRFC